MTLCHLRDDLNVALRDRMLRFLHPTHFLCCVLNPLTQWNDDTRGFTSYILSDKTAFDDRPSIRSVLLELCENDACNVQKELTWWFSNEEQERAGEEEKKSWEYFWAGCRVDSLKLLCRAARKLQKMIPHEAMVERIFSLQKLVVQPQRNTMGADLLEAECIIRANGQLSENMDDAETGLEDIVPTEEENGQWTQFASWDHSMSLSHEHAMSVMKLYQKALRFNLLKENASYIEYRNHVGAKTRGFVTKLQCRGRFVITHRASANPLVVADPAAPEWSVENSTV
jgi:hypothetical protein